MQCLYCSHPETKVLESRQAEGALRRRRECLKCSNRFTTYEKAMVNFSVLKKDGREQPFQSEKIKNSIIKACGKVEEQQVELMTKRLEQKIFLKKTHRVKTTEIGKMVLRELRKYDKMAYVRFASIHKSIEDPKLLEKELQLVA